MASTDTLLPETETQVLFPPETAGTLFQQWLQEIQVLLDIIQYNGTLDQEKLHTFFQSFLDALQGNDSFQHYQILDEAIPQFRRRNLSAENVSAGIIKLREIILDYLFTSQEFQKAEQIKVLNRILKKFEDIDHFLNRNYVLHCQIEKEEGGFDETTHQVPAIVFQTLGERFQGKTRVNNYFFKLFHTNHSTVGEEIWKQIIPSQNFSKLKKSFENKYRERKSGYEIKYSLRLKNGKYLSVLERGHIEYHHSGKPVRICGIICPLTKEPAPDKNSGSELQTLFGLANLSQQAVAVCRKDGFIVEHNPYFAQLLQENSNSLQPTNIFNWFFNSNGNMSGNLESVIKERTSRMPFDQEVKENGETRKIYRIGVMKIESETDSPQFVVVARDVTAEKQVKQENDHLHQRLEILKEIKRQLASNPDQKNLLEEIVQLGMELLPTADAASFIKFEREGLHFAAARGYDISILKNIFLFKSRQRVYQKFLKYIEKLREGSKFFNREKMVKVAEQFLTEKEIQFLKKNGHLDGITSGLIGLVVVHEKPFALFKLDSLDSTKSFTEADKMLLDIYLQFFAQLLDKYLSINKLIESRNKYQVLFDHSPFAQFIIRDEKILMANPAFFTLTGFHENELEKMSWKDLFPENEQETLIHRMNNSSNQPREEESKTYHLITKKKEKILCSGYFKNLMFQQIPVKLIGMCPIMETEQKKILISSRPQKEIREEPISKSKTPSLNQPQSSKSSSAGEIEAATSDGDILKAPSPPSTVEAPDTVKPSKKDAYTVLVIDDEKGILETYEALFDFLGYQRIFATSGGEALEVFQKENSRIDLILLDYGLPDMDGKKVLNELKNINEKIPIILCSGYADHQGVAELMNEGIADVLPKPFTIENISQKLKKFLN
ncbi:MAG: hypothetical protein Kow0042_11030 [Calditrichia bacterium]